MPDTVAPDFDIAVTFAGEQRQFVETVVERVKADGFSVFYDEDAKADMWGEDLSEYFANVYERRARFAVMFISAEYAAKPWTRLERRSVLARALQERSAYLLPVRFDSTQLSGVRSTVAYLDAMDEGPEGIASAISHKLGRPQTTGEREFNGRVPRTDAEVATLLGERPDGWEYLLFAHRLHTGIECHANAYNDHRIKFAIGGSYVAEEDVLNFSSAELARLKATTDAFQILLDGDAQRVAMGEPGQPGDPALIEHLADRMIGIYAELLAWSYRLRGAAASTDEAQEMLRALADLANQPVDAIREFVADFRNRMDYLTAMLADETNTHISLVIKFDFNEKERNRYHRALESYAASRGA